MAFRDKYDTGLFGTLTALLFPVLGFLMSYYIKYYPGSIRGFWNVFVHDDGEQTQIFTLSMIPSLFLFYFILFQWKMDRASKSFVGVSIIYVTIFAYIKFL